MYQVLGIHHIGLTVPDMEAACRFFETVLGAIQVVSTGPLDVDEAFLSGKLGVPGDKRVVDIRILRCGNGTNLELFQYEGELAAEPLKRNSEIGGWHFAIEVDDVAAAVERLKTYPGVTMLEGPSYIEAGPLQGLTWIYFKTPWGQFLELVGTSGPLGAESTGGAALWSPARPS